MILSYDPDVDIKVWVIFDNMLSVGRSCGIQGKGLWTLVHLHFNTRLRFYSLDTIKARSHCNLTLLVSKC